MEGEGGLGRGQCRDVEFFLGCGMVFGLKGPLVVADCRCGVCGVGFYAVMVE